MKTTVTRLLAALIAVAGPAAAADTSPSKTTIYVIGDSLGQSLHFGLYQAYKGDKRIVIRKKTKVSSGMVRDDYYDWVAKAEKLAGSTKMDVVVMMLGGNDTQPIRVDGKRYRARILTDDWRKEYGARVEALMKSFLSRGVTMVWVGLPIQRIKKNNKVGAAINAILREKAEALGARYIHIYDMYADDKGRYATRLVDDKGRRKRMRDRDGVHFSVPGVLWLGRKVRAIVDAEIEAAREKRELLAKNTDKNADKNTDKNTDKGDDAEAATEAAAEDEKKLETGTSETETSETETSKTAAPETAETARREGAATASDAP